MNMKLIILAILLMIVNCKETSFCNSASNTFIPFKYNGTSYGIYTQYYLTHSENIKIKLHGLGYAVYDTQPQICGWIKIISVTDSGDILVQLIDGFYPVIDNKVIVDLQTVLATTYPILEVCLIILGILLVLFIVTILAIQYSIYVEKQQTQSIRI
jgi:uncharacterized membrane protein